MIKPGLYRHYKGKNYRVVGLATHSETEEGMVIYYQEAQPERLWVRPLSMWSEEVEVDGRVVRRFEFLGD